MYDSNQAFKLVAAVSDFTPSICIPRNRTMELDTMGLGSLALAPNRLAADSSVGSTAALVAARTSLACCKFASDSSCRTGCGGPTMGPGTWGRLAGCKTEPSRLAASSLGPGGIVGPEPGRSSVAAGRLGPAGGTAGAAHRRHCMLGRIRLRRPRRRWRQLGQQQESTKVVCCWWKNKSSKQFHSIVRNA